MDAIETLMAEHRQIERAIDALLAFAESTRRGAPEDKAELGRFVAFIREFADARHHGKEEGVLFEAMVEAGFPRQSGPIGVMLADHDQGRRYVGALDALATAPSAWGDAERQALAEAAFGYGDLLRGHIQKEDAILYPMALRRLPGALLARLDEACAVLDAGHAADGTQARLERLGAELLARHLARPADAA